MKHWKLFIGLLFSASLAWGDAPSPAMQMQQSQPGFQTIGPFGMLNTQDDPTIIGANEAQDLLNVDVTPGGRSVKKRSGTALDFSFTISTNPPHGAYKFFDAAGNEIRLWGQDIGLWASVAGGTYVRVATGTVNATWQCTDYLGNAYCVTSSRDTPVKTNGTLAGSSYLATYPLGTMIASTPDRILIAGTAANPERITYSASGNPTDFTIGTQNSSSSFEPITSPGSGITHLAYRYGKWLWWKDASFGFITMTNQFDLVPVTISNYIGTLDNTDVYDQGITYFRGSDNQFWAFDGSNLYRISRAITPTVNSANRRKSNSWTQTSQSDFQSGTASPSNSLSFTTTSGSILLSTSTQQVNNPDFESGPNNVTNSVTSWSANWSSNEGTFRALTSYSPCGSNIGPENGTFLLSSGNGSGQTGQSLQVIDTSSNVITSTSLGTTGVCSWTSAYLINQAHAGTTVMLRVSNPTSSFGTSSLVSNSFTWPGGVQFWYAVNNDGTGNIGLDNIITFASTGTYYSAVNNAANLTSWNTLSVTDSLNGASTISYYTRAATNTYTQASSTPAWTAQTKNTAVAASTGTYMQFRADFSLTAPTETPRTDDFTFNWFEGSAADKMYGSYFDYAIWFAVSLGTSSTVNNRVLKYDLLNQGWTMYDIASNGFLVYNNVLYTGDSSVGKTYLYTSNVTSDNNVAINAYWKSKDFFGGSPFLDNDLRNISWFTKTSSGTTLTITYTTNRATTSSYAINLFNANQSFIRHNRNFPAGLFCGLLSLKFGDNSSNVPWEVYGGQYTYNPKPWNVYP